MSIFKKFRIKSFRGFRDSFFYLGIISAILLFFSLIFPSRFSNQSKFSLKNESNSQNLFFSSFKNSLIESPDFSLIEGNSLISISSPMIINPKVLGALVSEESEIRKEIIEYEVQSGDTLTSISENFGISLNTLLWANNLNKNSLIKPGQKLIVLPISGVIHHVGRGETLNEIAKKYKADIKKIIEFNELENEEIFAGDILIIPDGVMPLPSTPRYAEIPLASSYFIFPTTGRITQGLHWFNAIDIANECGTPIFAAAGGEVLKVKYGYNQGAGNYLTILHLNGIITLYGHILTSFVNSGNQVSQGQIIALVGGQPGTSGAGRSTGCHLHFGVQGARNPFAF